MTYLILDTSTDQCLIALAKENQIIAEEIFTHGNLLSQRLLPSIRALIETHIQSPKNLSGIAFGIGPGSYTGTRLGVAVAKSLAFGLQIPIKTFSSPLAFLPKKEGTFVFFIPARSGQFFALSGSITSSQVIQRDTSLFTPEEIEKFEATDFLICSSLANLPFLFRKKTCHTPTPNLRSLCLFLSEQKLASLENVELLYLHTPL
jgi:tRNA threonylcarbamoyl adenosine modification protein YeaZ